MREEGGAAAPVKIDPPHSFPTFSPREVCYHERGWGEEEEEDGGGGERRGGDCAGGLAGVTYHRVCLCVSTSLDLREPSRVHTCTRIHVCALARAPRWERRGGERRAHVGARGQIRGTV